MLWLLLACTPMDGDSASDDVSVEPTDHPAVVRVRWDGDGSDATVTWTDDGREHLVTASADADGFYADLALGTPREVDFTWFVDGSEVGSGTAETTGASLDLEVTLTGTLPRPVLTTVNDGERWLPVLFGVDGTVRWWFETEETIDMATLRARLVDDTVFFTRFDVRTLQELTPAEYYASALSGETTVDTLEGHHHDFTFVDDDLAYITSVAMTLDDGREVFDDRLRLRTEDGDESTLFSTATAFEPELMASAGDGETWGWANHLFHDDDGYWMSLRNLNRLVHLDDEGVLDGVLGENGDWQGAHFRNQHGGMATEGGVLLHDNDGGEAVRLLEFALLESGDAEVLWEYQPEPDWNSPALGDAVRLDDGSTLVSWGVFSTLEWLDEDGVSQAVLELPDEMMLGYFTPLDPTY